MDSFFKTYRPSMTEQPDNINAFYDPNCDGRDKSIYADRIYEILEHKDEILSYYDSLYNGYYDLVMSDLSISRGKRQRSWEIREDREDLLHNFDFWKEKLKNETVQTISLTISQIKRLRYISES